MTDRRAFLEFPLAGLALAITGLLWPLRSHFAIFHLIVFLTAAVIFLRIRRSVRPFGVGLSRLSAVLVAIPAARGGAAVHTLWLALVWGVFFEYAATVMRLRWIRSVRNRHRRRRLESEVEKFKSAAADLRSRSNSLHDEITLYQTVYDLAMRQTVGMTRSDILTSAWESLKELARRRSLSFRSVYLSLTSGEDYDLRQCRQSVEVPPRLKRIREELYREDRPGDGGEDAIRIKEGVWVCLPIRYQDKILGFLCMEFEPDAPSRLSPTDKKVLTVTADLFGLALQNNMLYEQVNQMAITDRLTGLYVLWYFKDRLKEEVHRAMRTRRPLSLLMMDLDHFKKVNDTHGHLAGDAVLKETAKRVKTTLREGDFVVRYGGEEMAAILPETASASATQAAERIRAAIESAKVVTQSRPLSVTISIGLSDLTMIEPDEDPSITAARLIKGADEALYRAKRSGRNCVKRYDEPAGVPMGSP